MNVTFMIGNGFDLRLGMKTRYTDMYDGYISTPSDNEIIEIFKATLKSDSSQKYQTWGDFEIAMAHHAKNFKKEEDFIARHIVRATSSRAAKSRRARLAHLEVMEAPGKEEGVVRFSFPFTKDVGKEVLKIENLEIGYNGNAILPPINFNLYKRK